MKTHNTTVLSIKKESKKKSILIKDGSSALKTKTLLLLLWGILVGQVTYGQAWDVKSDGTIFNYVINNDKTNHMSALRLQTQTNKGWVLFNNGKLNWVYTTSSDINQDVSGFSPLMTLQANTSGAATLEVKGGIRSSEIVWGSDTTERFRFFFDHSDGTSQDKEIMSLSSDGRINIDGSLGIGTNNPGDYKFAVNGKIRAKEIKVETGWADYVFKEEYHLPTLEEVEQHIAEKGHLINIPSAQDVEENGIYLGEMNKLLLEKIEELTLYTLQQQKEIENLKTILKTL